MAESRDTHHGDNSAPTIMRFQLTTVLQPGGSASCHEVRYSDNADDYTTLTRTRTVYDPHYRFFGLTSEFGWARRMPDSHHWEVISMEGCLVRHAKVYTKVSALGTGTVTIWYWNPAAGPAAEASSGVTVTVRDFKNKTWEVGQRVFVYYEPKSRSWYVLASAGGDLTYFELTADLAWATAPGADNAKVLEWDAGTSSYKPTGATIRVYDSGIVAGTYGNWVGRAPGGAYVGYQGFATIGESGRYEVVWMEEQARFIKFRLNARLKYNAASAGATLVRSWDGRDPPAGTITVYNSVTNVAGVYQYWGPNNAVGYAVFDDSESKYKIISLETDAKHIEFTMASGSAGTAAFTAGTATGATVNNYWDGKNPGATVDIQDPQGLFTRACVGAKGIATWNEQYDSGNGGYVAIECQSKAGYVDFTLVNAMAGGTSSSGATVNDYGGSQQDVQSPGSTVTVYDDQGLWKYAPVNAKGRAIYDAVEDKYRIVACQLKRQYLRGTLSGALTSTGSLSVTASYGNGIAVSGTVTVQNPGSFFTGAGGEEAMAVYDADADQWLLVWVECP